MTFPPQNWPDLELWLQQLHDKSLPWPSIWSLMQQSSHPPQTWDEAVLQFERADQTFAAELDQAIEQLAARGVASWEAFSPGALAVLRVRFEILYCSACGLQTGRPSSPETPLLFPQIPFPAFARWLFHDWWREHGPEEAAYLARDPWAESTI